MSDSARLDQFGIADFNEVFKVEELQIHPGTYRESWGFNSVENCTHYAAFHFSNLPEPFDFWLYLPASETAVDSRHLQMCQRVLHALNRLDARAREPFDEANAEALKEDDDFDLDRDVTLDYVLIEEYGAELHYSCDHWNNEYGSHFKWIADDQWEYTGLA